MKTYVLILSKVFPKRHLRSGEATCFACQLGITKLHTIRANYPLWKKRIAEVQAGNAVLSVRQWCGKPYRSKQVLLKEFTKANGIGIQRLEFDQSLFRPIIGTHELQAYQLAVRDGLSLIDWTEWFILYDLTKPMAIIHFTDFRY
jgi:hypothetical protein|nr:MAG TPA: hypothetical protein [Caudoviricetes sp.]